MSTLTNEQIIRKVYDIQQIQNVASLHEYYHNALMHKEELDEIWVKKTPGASWANNTDKYDNMDSIRKFYEEGLKGDKQRSLELLNKIDPSIEVKPENLGAGILWYHMLTTPVIEVAGDWQTAKGVWMSFGHVSGPLGKEVVTMWTSEKYGIDFAKEDGEWKIWHLSTYVDYYTPIHGSWLNPAENIAAGGPIKAEPGAAMGFAPPDVKGEFYKGYTLKTVPTLNPKPPVPYYTFSETFSY